MRVKCHSVDEFLENLRGEPADAVLQKVVRVSIVHRPAPGGKDDPRVPVVFQASAVIEIPEQGQYLLELGENCGADYLDASQDKTGTLAAEGVKKKIQAYCELNGLEVRPGIIDF